MESDILEINASVGIVGGGPAGLMVAMELGRQGVSCIVFEQETGEPWLPKANSSTSRTMEYYRRHGIAEKIRDVGLAENHSQDIAYYTRYGTGYELARFKGQTRNEARQWSNLQNEDWPTPEPVSRSNQLFIEPVLREAALSHDGVQLFLGRRVLGVETLQDCVRLTVEIIETNTIKKFNFHYIAACDGARSSIRKALKIKHEGVSDEERLFMGGQMLAVRLNAPSFYNILKGKPAWQSLAMNHERRSIMGALDGKGIFTFHTQVPADREADEDWVRESLFLTSGVKFEYEIIGMAKWTAGMTLVAEKFQEGRIFILGDAAHLFTPTGGLGYNTSIEDAVNLGWKLSAVCNRWAGPELLKSYEVERRPIALRNTKFARSLADNIGKIKIVPELERDDEQGKRLRDDLGKKLLHHATIEFNTQGIQLGVQYCNSPIIISDGSSLPIDDPHKYLPTATPGCRAPHVWLNHEESIFDRFGINFTLLNFNLDINVDCLLEASDTLNIPIHLLKIDNQKARKVYGADLVIVRPDHHVAWRSNKVPAKPLNIMKKISGWPLKQKLGY